jgi:hypothetical protein
MTHRLGKSFDGHKNLSRTTGVRGVLKNTVSALAENSSNMWNTEKNSLLPKNLVS